ncbi:hypothetical protein [Streptomyces sp. MP131-18]|uniref:hypothetical protein n=1 Tax=Streptomyces sp. MP131-18 TaxID=1857892 RepID=UPI00097C741B|nr:hypothetical protein [Streptomyces sp. MP131-18]ONK10114.1 hypothetical protein STBA_08360 [Streptomyces sp. MP131-18]
MADGTEPEGYLAGLADLAESGRRHAEPLAAERIRARGERRLRRRRTALASGGALLAASLALGGLSLTRAAQGPEPPAVPPTPTASPFVPPTPAPGEEYASELGYVYGAVLRGDTVQVTVERIRAVRGTVAPVGPVHTLTLPRGTLVETRQLADGNPADVRLDRLVSRLADGPRWVFVIDYDSEGRVHSLREAYWLSE